MKRLVSHDRVLAALRIAARSELERWVSPEELDVFVELMVTRFDLQLQQPPFMWEIYLDAILRPF